MPPLRQAWSLRFGGGAILRAREGHSSTTRQVEFFRLLDSMNGLGLK